MQVKKVIGSLTANWVLAVFLLGFVGHAAAVAQSPGTFKSTGDMTMGRVNHTATLLPNGGVLITGGVGSDNSITATAEFYDPTTGMFSRIGGMTTPRRSHTATALPDGRVLIAGGTGPLGPLGSTELYDPSTGIFTRTGDMVSGGNASGGGQAIFLRNGKVFIPVNFSAQLYEPVTGTFTAAGPYADSTFWVYTATMLTDGRILLTGCGGPSCDIGVAELYDPATNTFSRTGPMSEWYSVNRATLLMNGRVLFVGNSEEDDLPSEVEIYDPATESFALIGSMIGPHDFSTVTLLADGKVVIAGSRLADATGSAELYDPVLGTFSTMGSSATARYGHKAILLRDGNVLLVGGVNAGSGALDLTTARYVPAASPASEIPWQQAISGMQTAAGTNSLNFWQWTWYWQRSPTFAGAPSGFGSFGSIDDSPGMSGKVIAAGGGDGLQMVSAEQWTRYYRQAICAGCWDY